VNYQSPAKTGEVVEAQIMDCRRGKKFVSGACYNTDHTECDGFSIIQASKHVTVSRCFCQCHNTTLGMPGRMI